MVYIALLRGINVGGKNRIAMAELRATFEREGMTGVSTYINSGNVIFGSPSRDVGQLTEQLERAIERDFGLPIRVLTLESSRLLALAEKLPDSWANDQTAKCDVLFLWDEVDEPELLERLPAKPGIDEIIYAPGALLWRVERSAVTRSGLMRLVGTELYQQMTVRNCNTLRKLAEKIHAAEAS